MNQLPLDDIRPHLPVPVGQQINVDHVACPAGRDTRRRLYIRQTSEATLSYCHNCGGHRVDSIHGKTRPIDVLKKLVKQSEATELLQKEVRMPDDATLNMSEWPVEAQAWLFQYNFDEQDIRDAGICYSPSWNRVILPVFDGGKLIFWQGRRIDPIYGPKYISVRSAHKPLFTVQATPGIPRAPINTVVIVEDYLSALRIAKSGVADAVALLGTDGPDDLPQRLAGYKFILVWLDDDTAGRSKSAPLAARLRTTTNARVGRVLRAQPKELTNTDIRNTIIVTPCT